MDLIFPDYDSIAKGQEETIKNQEETIKNQNNRIFKLEEQIKFDEDCRRKDYEKYQMEKMQMEQRIAFLYGIIKGMAATLDIDYKELVYDNYNEAR